MQHRNIGCAFALSGLLAVVALAGGCASSSNDNAPSGSTSSTASTTGFGGSAMTSGGVAGSSGSGESGGAGDVDAGQAGAAGSTGTNDAGAPDGTAGDGGAVVSDPGTEGDGKFTIPQPSYPPEATLQPGVTAGRIQTISVTSQIYPNTTRTVWIYTPAGYVADTPAPFMVLQDGRAYIDNFRLNTVLDNLIAKKQLPMMVAIFIPPSANRSVEYDTVDDTYARFVLNEVFPAVEKLAVKLTSDPQGGGAGGHSSGGIAAFTMGWSRPDRFRRILTNSGSFTNIRGGDQYWTGKDLVRTTMPLKPLRVTQTAGTNDLQSPRWQQANESMFMALSSAGYHDRYLLITAGTHDQRSSGPTTAQQMLWLWRGYPIAK